MSKKLSNYKILLATYLSKNERYRAVNMQTSLLHKDLYDILCKCKKIGTNGTYMGPIKIKKIKVTEKCKKKKKM